MSEQHLHRGQSLSVSNDQPLIGVMLEEQGCEVVHYFTEDAVVDAPASDPNIQAALDLAGAWRDLNWEEATAELDWIRHESRPTPPAATGDETI